MFFIMLSYKKFFVSLWPHTHTSQTGLSSCGAWKGGKGHRRLEGGGQRGGGEGELGEVEPHVYTWSSLVQMEQLGSRSHVA